ncbi:MAG: hypothetical protein V4555_20430 [Acidobacteriota bacterium]
MDISIFAGYTNVVPDYSYQRDTGVAFGANITRYYHFPIKPSLELRANLANGPIVNETFYLFGVRGQVDMFHDRIHPYMDFLIGPGFIHYNFVPVPSNPSYRGDNGVVKSPGGGVDFDVYRHFQLKADFQGTFWKIGKNDTLTPQILTFGVVYRIPFHRNFSYVNNK